MNEFYVPQNIEMVRRPLMNLIVADIGAKNSTGTSFFVRGRHIRFPSMERGQAKTLSHYENDLVSWAINPDDEKLNEKGVEGHAYALMMTHVLKALYKDHPGIVVRQTPFTMDNIMKKNMREWGPGGDIIIGQEVVDQRTSISDIRPLALVEATLRYDRLIERKYLDGVEVEQEDRKPIFNTKLKVPVVQLIGREAFPNPKKFIMEFVKAEDPLKYAADLARDYGEVILSILPKSIQKS
jgi:hypothetical protein